jgi:hypothetical protein
MTFPYSQTSLHWLLSVFIGRFGPGSALPGLQLAASTSATPTAAILQFTFYLVEPPAECFAMAN